MFCKHCGTENENNTKFCRECGQPLTEQKEQETSEVSSEKSEESLSDKIKKIPRNLLMAVCAGSVVLIVSLCVLLGTGKSIDMNKYVTTEVSGYDGYGTARVAIDWDAVEEKYGNKLSFTGEAGKAFGGLVNLMSPMDALQDCVRIDVENNSGLSNGDTVSYTWKINEDIAKMLKCKIKCKDDSFKVSDLEKAETFDAFNELEVKFTGIAPEGKVQFNYTGSELRSSDFHCDKSQELSNGDIITISLNDSQVSFWAEQLGKVPESLKKQYTVEGLSSYVTKSSEIDEASLAEMQKQASDKYISRTASWGESETLESLSYLGNYLLTAKNGEGNYLYLVYKAEIRNYYADSRQTYDQVNELYWYARFEDLLVNEDGTVEVDLLDCVTPIKSVMFDTSGGQGAWSKRWSYYGYDSLDALYAAVVTSNLDSYNYEDNINGTTSSTDSAAKTENKSIAEKEGWIFADSNTILLTESDLADLSAEECKIARNEIYARHGRKFKDPFLQSYFNSCEWYQGTVEADNFNEQNLNETELANRNLIAAYEAKKGYN